MELRSVEGEIDRLTEKYESIRTGNISDKNNADKDPTELHNLLAFCIESLPSLVGVELHEEEGAPAQDDNNDNNSTKEEKTNTYDDHKILFENLQSMEHKVRIELESKVDRFRLRLNEKDPITKKARYGIKTSNRVGTMVEKYDKLQNGINMIFLGSSHGNDNKAGENNDIRSDENDDDDHNTTIVNILTKLIQLHEQSIINQLKQKTLSKEEQEKKQKKLEEKKVLEQNRIMQLEKEKQEMEKNRLAELANKKRIERKIKTENEKRATQQWLDSIEKGTKNGIKIQLNQLCDSIRMQAEKDESDMLMIEVVKEEKTKAALYALRTIYTQITRHPENINHRRIRSTHPKFLNDIGQYKGGVELLIASGFMLGTIASPNTSSNENNKNDDNNNNHSGGIAPSNNNNNNNNEDDIDKDEGTNEIKCYICKEPNLETDFDKWSSWFDSLKVTLELVQEKITELQL